ncbi:MAG: type IV pilus secretin PilQ [Xanthomonadales bacterium]|nr:type IV pilus secretin PilQ [Gammaproteobacteria bacterium]MBT8057111.1 type IV pilus secretin PilQ [Gammaproteobacteria bacterium]NNL05238.1 type IV pilus secretin PilQ [Xanthomonadales bacterium]
MRNLGNGILRLVGLALIVMPLAALANTSLTGVEYVRTANGDVKLYLKTSGDAPDVTVFATESPARIVLDMADTESSVGADKVHVGQGVVQQYSAVTAGGRTRLVVDLSSPAAYDYSSENSQVVLTVAAGASGSSAAPASSGYGPAVTNVDFRLGEDGQARVIISTDKPGASLSVRENPGSLTVDLFGATLPESLDQRLDVMDFATPVQFIDSYGVNSGVRLELTTGGLYEHLAYESGNDYIIEVSELARASQVAEEEIVEFFEDKSYEGSRVTFNFQDIPVRSVLQLIADVSDLNIVVADSVGGNLTLRLTNVPWDQALDIVMDARNLDMRKNGNVLWIAPTAEIAAREQQLLQAQMDRRILEPLQTVLIPVSYASAEELRNLIVDSTSNVESEYGLLSERGSVSVDARTNTLLITDTADRILEVRELVTKLDYAVQQVQIESRIVIAQSDFAHELGVRFGVTALHLGSNIGILAADGFAADTVNPAINPRDDGLLDIPSYPGRYQVNLPATDPGASSLGLSFLSGDVILDLELSALESEGEGEVISTPRVITANQAEAFIQQGVEIPYQQASSSGATNVQFKEAVLELKVVPLITPDQRIQMDLEVRQDTVGEIFIGALGAEIPSIDTRELQTTVLVGNGDTVVLGGIFQDETSSNEDKVPWLGDIPVMGALFRRRSNETKKRELLIFVTPTIIEDTTTM